jgi:F-type H+-transporting ATPase subunit a
MISFEAEKIFLFNRLEITNTYLASLLALFFLIFLILFLNRKFKEIPNRIQSISEMFFETFYDFWTGITGMRNLKIFTFCFTFFIYILFSNWMGILPGFSSFYVKEGGEKIHLLRSVYSDLNMTLTLATISVLGINILGFFHYGFKYLKRYKGFVGLLELFAEFAKILSFSFRLFGNVFAGETLLLVVGMLLPLLAPIPFLVLEIFVGFIQALIFFTLTSVFLKVALSEH